MNIVIILIILLVGTVVTYMSGNRFASKVALLFSVFAAVFSGAILLQYGSAGTTFSAEWISNPHISFSLNADGLAIAMLLLTTILTSIVLLTAWSTEIKNERLFYSLVMFMVFAMCGAFLSSDALLYYVFWELSLIPIYFIIVLWGNGEVTKRRKAAMTFFMYTFAGSLFMLAAIIYLYTKVGSFQLEAFYNADLSMTEQVWIFLGFFLAYAIKIPIFPFHTWQANAYQKAPAVGTMMLGGLMSKMGAYSVIRWQLPVTGDAALELRWIIVPLCIIGFIYGTIIALKQDNIKRFFAYISMSHVGFIAAGAYSLTFDGLLGAVLLILAHGVGVIALFFASDVIYKRTNRALISQLGGIKNQASKFTGAFFMTILAAISIPLSFNFVGEFTIMYGLFQVNIWYAVMIGTSMFLGAFVMLRMYQQVMLGEAKLKAFDDLDKMEGIIFASLTILFIFFGIYSKPIVDLVTPSLEVITTYINR